MVWRWLVMGLWIFWLMVYWRGGLDILQDIRAASSRRDLSYLLILTGVTFCIVINGILMSLQAEIDTPFAPIGAILVLMGVAGTFYCRQYLGKFWTAENTLHTDHQIIDTGPYAYVRHPIYTAAILLYLGTGITFPVWWNLLFVTVAVLVYMLKTAHEDHFLATQLPGYAAYQQRVTYRLIPMFW